jgi:hypothetical protein
MKKTPSVNLEMAIVLPLGVVAHQLMKIEADLRQLNMKALDFASEHGNVPRDGIIEARLEKIHEALDSIRELASNIAADLRPDAAHPAKPNRNRRADRDD